MTDVPTPAPAADKYLIEIHSAGTNFFDILQIQGKYQHQPPLPWVGGAEFAGTILAIPTSSSHPRFKVGDRVFGATQGAYATHVLAPENTLLPVPPDGASKMRPGCSLRRLLPMEVLFTGLG